MVNGWRCVAGSSTIRGLMWELYRKTLIPMQLLIVAACVTFYYITGKHWQPILVVFLVMQVGSLAGAWWGARMRQRISRSRDDLPLKK